jgi:hypothetical protein
MTDAEDPSGGFFAVTPNGVAVECSAERWTVILRRHPALSGLANEIRRTIEDPDEIRRSRWDSDVWLCYRRRQARWLCAVIAPRSGRLVTAYPSSAVKAGDLIWTPSA